MKQVKKIEIIADSLEINKILAKLEANGVTGYTVIKDVIGKGERGVRGGDGLSDVLKNSLIITVCEPGQVKAISEAVQPELKKFGGVCLISDAQWLDH
ncbi:MAG: hypothetical protein K9J12_09440 [Melioribacteraceae bacterium]|nr:hypothetical protein [Melioribacteraceae bacterium]MCF8264414.1 hypothetical protein [Melioribacteraceae bacterium]MCF8414420.1 hypothetical protein [Melioribacteraceae bacterium]MCF8432472.1 hypothetical protein [Melioribacteraceae bacterium]